MQQTIARWETGKAEPNLAALSDLAAILNTSIDELLGIGRSPKVIENGYRQSVYIDQIGGF
jgi:transcriptional regulator with XRE-family HTH domain